MFEGAGNWSVQKWVFGFLCIGGGALVTAVVFWAGAFIWNRSNVEVTLPTIVIIGVLILLVALALISILFAMTNLANKDQPLGLPEGSVRAVIALSLVVLFAIVAIFLYANVSQGGKIESAKMTAAQARTWQTKLPNAQVLHIEPAVEGLADGTEVLLFYRAVNSAAGDDLAKQLIVLLGTLVTAVASFYFGANSVSSATAAANRAVQPAAPNPTKVAPSSIKPGGGPQQLTITGTDLNQVSAVQLVKDGTTINATDVTTNPTQVTCKVTIGANCEQGKWDVVVSDGIKPATLKGGVEIQSASAPNAAAAIPKITGTDPQSLKVDGGAVKLTISGENLAPIKQVNLQKDNENIATEDVQASAKQVTCKVTVQSGRAPGKWALLLGDGTTTKTFGEIEVKA